MKPALNFPPDLLLKAQNVKVAFFDVDGVLTDGRLFYGDSGESHKCFNTLDGHGLKMLQRGGITPVIISGRDSAALRVRLHALGIEHVYLGVQDKHPAAQQALQTLQANWHEAAAMGDDWPDFSVMRRCALSCAPANAHIEISTQAHYTTRLRGGEGAAREFCDLLLIAKGCYAQLLREHQN